MSAAKASVSPVCPEIAVSDTLYGPGEVVQTGVRAMDESRRHSLTTASVADALRRRNTFETRFEISPESPA